MASIIAGVREPANKDGMDWGLNGLIAYACRTYIIIVERHPFRRIHALEGHGFAVSTVEWLSLPLARASTPLSLQLASGDVGGVVCVWDVLQGLPTSVLRVREGAKEVCSVRWRPGTDSQLLALYNPNIIILWDLATGTQIWRYESKDPVSDISIDPHTFNNALLCTTQGWTFFLSNLWGPESEPTLETTKVLIRSGRGLAATAPEAVYQHAVYAKHRPRCVFFVLPRELLLFDLQIMSTVCSVVLVNEPDFERVLVSADDPFHVVCQHKHGMISSWVLQRSREEGLVCLGWTTIPANSSASSSQVVDTSCLSPLRQRTSPCEVALMDSSGTLMLIHVAFDSDPIPRLTHVLEGAVPAVVCVSVCPYQDPTAAPLICTATSSALSFLSPRVASCTTLRHFSLPKAMHGIALVEWVTQSLVAVVSVTEDSRKSSVLDARPRTYHSRVALVHILSGEVSELQAMSLSGPEHISGCLPSPLRRWLLILKSREGGACEIGVWSLKTRKHIHTMHGAHGYTAACWVNPSRTESTDKTAQGETMLCVTTDGVLALIGVSALGVVAPVGDPTRLSAGIANIRCVAVCERMGAVGDVDGNIVVWDLAFGPKQILNSITTGRGPIKRLMFNFSSPHMLMANFRNRNLGVWDLSEDTCVGLKAGPATALAADWLHGDPQNRLCLSHHDGSLRIVSPPLEIPPTMRRLNAPRDSHTITAHPPARAALIKCHLNFPLEAISAKSDIGELAKLSTQEFQTMLISKLRDHRFTVQTAPSRDSQTESTVTEMTRSIDNCPAVFQGCYDAGLVLSRLPLPRPSGSTIAERAASVARSIGDVEECQMWELVSEVVRKMNDAKNSGQRLEYCVEDSMAPHPPLSSLLSPLAASLTVLTPVPSQGMSKHAEVAGEEEGEGGLFEDTGDVVESVPDPLSSSPQHSPSPGSLFADTRNDPLFDTSPPPTPTQCVQPREGAAKEEAKSGDGGMGDLLDGLDELEEIGDFDESLLPSPVSSPAPNRNPPPDLFSDVGAHQDETAVAEFLSEINTRHRSIKDLPQDPASLHSALPPPAKTLPNTSSISLPLSTEAPSDPLAHWNTSQQQSSGNAAVPVVYGLVRDPSQVQASLNQSARVHCLKGSTSKPSSVGISESILLGQLPTARHLLCQTPNTADSLLTSLLKACVVAGATGQDVFHDTVKSVAERLFSISQHDEAVQLLCLVGEAAMAVRLLQQQGMWNEAALVIKTRLTGPEHAEAMMAWGTHLLTADNPQMSAVDVFIGVGAFVAAIQALLVEQRADTAALLMFFLEDSANVSFSNEFRLLVILEYAKTLFQTKCLKAACLLILSEEQLGETVLLDQFHPLTQERYTTIRRQLWEAQSDVLSTPNSHRRPSSGVRVRQQLGNLRSSTAVTTSNVTTALSSKFSSLRSSFMTRK